MKDVRDDVPEVDQDPTRVSFTGQSTLTMVGLHGLCDRVRDCSGLPLAVCGYDYEEVGVGGLPVEVDDGDVLTLFLLGGVRDCEGLLFGVDGSVPSLV